jgi:hypothetical protein
MSDDLLRTARQLLSVLEAGEAYLRSTATESLSFKRMMAVERRAAQRCAEMLEALGAQDDFRVDDATDELLMGLSRIRDVQMPSQGTPARQSSSNVRAAPSSPGSGYEPLDDGPEGAADEGNDLRSEEEVRQGGPASAPKKTPGPAPSRAESLPSKLREAPQQTEVDTAEIGQGHSAKGHAAQGHASQSPPAQPASQASSQGGSNGAVAAGVGAAMAAALESYVTFDGEDASDEEPTLNDARAITAPDDDPFSNLVQFDVPASPTPETVQRVATPPKGAARARRNSGSETFDLMPDVSSDDLSAFEEEEVTVVKSADSIAEFMDAKPKGRASPASSSSSSSQVGKTVARIESLPPADKSGRAASKTEPRSSTASPAESRSRAPSSGSSSSPGPSQSTSSQVRAPKTPPPASQGRSAQSTPPVSSATPPSVSRTSSPAKKEPARSSTAEPAQARTSRPSGAGSSSSSGLGARDGTPGPAPQRAASSGAPRSAQVSSAPASSTAGNTSGRSSSREVLSSPPPSASSASVSTRGAKPASSATGAGANRATSGLYGGASVPTIRDSDEPRPRAAAIQLNASGTGGRVIGLEDEDEPIEIGEAEDVDDDEVGGFSLQLHQQDDDDDDFEEDSEVELAEEDLEVIQPAQVTASAPSPEELAHLLNRARTASQSGDLQGSADLYSDVIDGDPDNVQAHVARGRLYLDLGDYSRAMSDFMVAEDIAPNDPEPQVAIGDLYFARKDYRKAIDYFNAALQIAPNHAMAFCRRGISHYYRKNYKEAVDDLLRSERLDPDIPNIQTYVSMAKKKVKSR